MTTTDVGTRKQRGGIEIELFNPNCASIRSNWPVTLPRGNTSIAAKLLREALEGGVEAKCDTKRASFFEADIGHAWFYFHIAYELGRIYLVAALIR
jgi:hypothetical protein